MGAGPSRLRGAGRVDPAHDPADAPPRSASQRAALVALLEAYDERLRLADGLEPLDPSLGRGRRLARLLARPLLHVLFVRHVDRMLRALARRLAARAALAADPRAHDADRALLERYLGSLPTAWWYRRAVLVVIGAAFLIAYLLANHVLRTPEENLLGNLTTAVLTLDHGRAVDAFDHTTLEHVGGAAVIALWSLWAVLLPSLVAFRWKRASFVDRVYALERDTFRAVGQRAPRELQLDLLMRAMLAVSVLAFGTGTVLFGLTTPTGEQQLHGAARHLVGSACVALGAAALASIAAVAWARAGESGRFVRWERANRPLTSAVVVAFAALVALAVWSR